jgi:hypothetical protein
MTKANPGVAGETRKGTQGRARRERERARARERERERARASEREREREREKGREKRCARLPEGASCGLDEAVVVGRVQPLLKDVELAHQFVECGANEGDGI